MQGRERLPPPQRREESPLTFSSLMGEEEERDHLDTASFSEIMGDMLEGKAPLPREVTSHSRFARRHQGGY